MAKSKGGCMGVVIMVGTAIALTCTCGSAVQKGNFATFGLMASVVVLIVSIVLALIYKKPEFEDESFGHMCKRWLWSAVAAAALGAAFFFALAPKALREAAAEANAEAGQTENATGSTATEQ